MSGNRSVLVTGSTGGQGGAVARRILDNGWGYAPLSASGSVARRTS